MALSNILCRWVPRDLFISFSRFCCIFVKAYNYGTQQWWGEVFHIFARSRGTISASAVESTNVLLALVFADRPNRVFEASN